VIYTEFVYKYLRRRVAHLRATHNIFLDFTATFLNFKKRRGDWEGVLIEQTSFKMVGEHSNGFILDKRRAGISY
jgi:hypothetical protein